MSESYNAREGIGVAYPAVVALDGIEESIAALIFRPSVEGKGVYSSSLMSNGSNDSFGKKGVD